MNEIIGRDCELDSLSITFLISLPRVLSRTMGRKAFGLSYDVLFSLGMTTVVEILKYLG